MNANAFFPIKFKVIYKKGRYYKTRKGEVESSLQQKFNVFDDVVSCAIWYMRIKWVDWTIMAAVQCLHVKVLACKKDCKSTFTIAVIFTRVQVLFMHTVCVCPLFLVLSVRFAHSKNFPFKDEDISRLGRGKHLLPSICAPLILKTLDIFSSTVVKFSKVL